MGPISAVATVPKAIIVAVFVIIGSISILKAFIDKSEKGRDVAD